MEIIVESPVTPVSIHALSPVTLSGGTSTVSPEEIAQAVEDYFTQNPASGEPALAAHLIDPTPHPVYDDMPSLALIFENGLI